LVSLALTRLKGSASFEASMIRAFRDRWVFAAAWLFLTSFAAGLAQDLVHTDDGCQVEVHCLACQRALVSASVGSTVPQWRPAVQPVGRVAPEKLAAVQHRAVPVSGSRAPPLAS